MGNTVLHLNNLYISFTGYWPEIGALVKSCTFKEFEAAVVLETNGDAHYFCSEQCRDKFLEESKS